MFIGLGNHKHVRTRSSVGIQVVNYVAELNNLTWHKNNNFPGEFARLNIYVDPKPPSRLTLNKSNSKKSEKNSPTLDVINYIPIEIVLFKPLLLMHISEILLVKHFEMSPSNIVVIHDDIEREIGKISLKLSGSSSGHSGLKSVIGCLDTEKFCRLRVGIGRPKTYYDRDTIDRPKTYHDRDTAYRPNTYNDRYAAYRPNTYNDRDAINRPKTYHDRDTTYKPKTYNDRDAIILQKYVIGTPMLEESNYFKEEVFPKCHDALIECCIDDDILQKNVLWN
ncbi:1868_t:CDS:2 [Entrophospora sp. SA101]|nr:1868_t:CDS:2 [Entrophospora sp. SA101]